MGLITVLHEPGVFTLEDRWGFNQNFG